MPPRNARSANGDLLGLPSKLPGGWLRILDSDINTMTYEDSLAVLANHPRYLRFRHDCEVAGSEEDRKAWKERIIQVAMDHLIATHVLEVADKPPPVAAPCGAC